MESDVTTGLYTRGALLSRLDEEVRRAGRYGEVFSLVVLDLDHFKSVNDAFGHSTGDAVLAEVAARLRQCGRGSDVAFRFGGDEFVILLPRTDREQASSVARRFAQAIAAAPLTLEPPLTLTASAGAATYPGDGPTAEALFERADARMYEAKREGRGLVSDDVAGRVAGALDAVGRTYQRAAALDQTSRFLAEVLASGRGLLTVEGVEGAGRSRMLREIASLAELRGFQTLTLRGEPRLRGEQLGALHLAWPGLSPDVQPGFGGEQRADAVAQAILGGSARPLLVLVDDPAELDAGTLAVVEALVGAEGARELGVVVALDADATPSPALRDLAVRHRIQLELLTPEALRAWLRSAFRTEPEEEVIDWLNEACAGVPGRVRAALVGLARRGALVPGPGQSWMVPADRLPSLRAPAPEGRSAVLGSAPRRASFLGRGDELREILRGLRMHRVVAVCGPDGVGKTSLAFEAAERAAGEFADGVVFLSDAGEGAAALEQLARLMAVPQAPGVDPVLRLLASPVRSMRLLVVVDDLPPRARSGRWARLLAGAPGIRILVTSRRAPAMPDRYLVQLSGMPLPGSGAGHGPRQGALELFLERAAEAGAAPVERLAALRLVHLVEGIPLAVEVAAALAAQVPPRELAREIQAELDRLSAYLPGEPAAELVLRATLDVAWRHLPTEQRGVLRRLSLFDRPFPADARRVARDAPPGLLEALADRGLVERLAGGEFRIHPVVRGHARAHLAACATEWDRAFAAFCEYHLALLIESERLLGLRADRAAAVDALAVRLQDLRRAWEAGIAAGRVELLREAAPALYALLGARGAWPLAARMLRAAAAVVDGRGGAGECRDALLARAGAALARAGRPRAAEPILRRAREAAMSADDPAREAFCLCHLSDVYAAVGAASRARTAAAAAVHAAERSHDPQRLVEAHLVAAHRAFEDDAARQAVAHLYEAMDGDPSLEVSRRAVDEAVAWAARLLESPATLALAAALLSRVTAEAAAFGDAAGAAASMLDGIAVMPAVPGNLRIITSGMQDEVLEPPHPPHAP